MLDTGKVSLEINISKAQRTFVSLLFKGEEKWVAIDKGREGKRKTKHVLHTSIDVTRFCIMELT